MLLVMMFLLMGVDGMSIRFRPSGRRHIGGIHPSLALPTHICRCTHPYFLFGFPLSMRTNGCGSPAQLAR